MMDEQTPTTTTSSKFSKRPNRKQLIIAGGVVAVVLLIAGIASLATGGSTQDKANTKSEQPQFTNYLKPQSELRIGEFRYVSACQVLPVTDARNTIGFTANTVIDENYFNTSIAAKPADSTVDYATTSCGYNIEGTDDSAILKLSTYQYFQSAAATKELANRFVNSDSGSKIISRFETVTKNGSSSAKSFTSQLTKTSSAIKAEEDASASRLKNAIKNDTDIPEQQLTIKSFDGYLLPYTGTTDDNAIEFYYKYHNVYYTLDYKPAKADIKPSLDQYSDAYLNGVADKLGKAMVSVNKNSRNDKLSQSPAPTIIGTSDKYGNTKLLESCSIVSDASYKAIFGSSAVKPITRRTLNAGASQPVTSTKLGDNMRRSSCQYSTFIAGGSSTTLRTGIFTGPSTDATTKWLKGYLADDPQVTRTPLQTTADEAIKSSLNENPLYASYYFRVGPYVGSLFPTNLTVDSQAQAINQDAIIAAINIMVANIKHDLALK